MSNLIIDYISKILGNKVEIPKDEILVPESWIHINLQDIREMTTRDFLECKKGEEVKILTNGGNPILWNYPSVKSAIIKSIEKGVKVKVITGPAIYVENGHNFLLEQALSPNKLIEMYIAPRNELMSYRIYGERKAWIEKFNPTRDSSKRYGKYYLNKKSNPFGVFGFLKYSRDFETVIKVYNLKRIVSVEEVLLLEKKDLNKIVKNAMKERIFIDCYEKKDLEKILVS